MKDVPSHVTGLGRRQEDDGIDEVFGMGDTAHRHNRTPVLVKVRIVVPAALDASRAGGDRVNTNRGCKLECELFR